MRAPKFKNNTKPPRCKPPNVCSGCKKKRKDVDCIYWPLKKIEQKLEPTMSRCNECSACKKKGSWEKFPCENPILKKKISLSSADKSIIIESLNSDRKEKGKRRSGQKKTEDDIHEKSPSKFEDAKVHILSGVADILKIPKLKKIARYFTSQPSQMKKSTKSELKRVALAAIPPVIATFSPFPREVLQIVQDEMENLSEEASQEVYDPLLQEVIKTYNQAPNKHDKIWILSTLVPKYTLKELQMNLGMDVSRRLHSKARRHFARWGAGGTAIFKKIKRSRISKDALTCALQFFFNADFIQKVAYGSHIISDGEGNESKIAAAQRKYKPEQIWKRYQVGHSAPDGKYTGTLKRSTFLKLVRAATSVDLKTLAALDNVYSSSS
mmetsp:Transcript_8438/g.10983  ORF Transcript_8438/g.10983 Transcript_8438/m.10983 type:complete len:381 (-) Transcript_8438:4-1146(-)